MADTPYTDVRTVVYSFVVADLFHFGHLQLLLTAKQASDFHICGVLTDDAAASYRLRPIANFDERVAILSQIRCVDRVVMQESRDPVANLRQIHSEFPEAQLVLVHGDDWKDIPGRAYIESIGGRVIQPEYYRRLSDLRIREELVKLGAPAHYEQFTEHFRIDNIVVFEKAQRQFVMSTKANTLRALRPLLRRSRIEPMVTFRVSEWTESRERLVALVRREFGRRPVVVRSSAVNEDTYHLSRAGAYASCVNVSTRSPRSIIRAVNEVIASYREKGNLSLLNQVLVQPHTADVRVSGVVFTRASQTGGAYYVINYDDRTGKTESVTGGAESRAIEIAHACPPARWPAEWRRLLVAVQEIERIIPGTPLDIEFAIDRRGRVTIFQVRPLVCPEAARLDADRVDEALREEMRRCRQAQRRVRHLAGAKAAFSDMAFWNPAEIIGDRPHPLEISLYRTLITDRVWHEALAPFGYADVTPAPLMVCFGGKPYIDLRCTCNALLPASLNRRLREKLVTHFLELLKRRPELHDKVEFEIIDNCFHFSLDRRLRRMRHGQFSADELAAYRRGLVEVTDRALAFTSRIEADVAASASSLAQSRARARHEVRRSRRAPARLIAVALTLIEECRTHGTVPFTLMARLAFIGTRFLTSMVERGWMREAEYDRFMDSVRTVATEMCEDAAAVAAGRMTRVAFLDIYGHLRPGTYEVCSPRYAADPGYFGAERPPADSASGASTTFAPRRELARTLARVLVSEGLEVSVDGLFLFIRLAIEARERIKFEFTKNLSDVLEIIAQAGDACGFSREELAFLDVPALARATTMTRGAIRQDWQRTIDAARERRPIELALSLPPLLFSPGDFEVVRHPAARPNFVTRKVLQGELVALNGVGPPPDGLQGKVVLLEKADPGFDWLFTKGIAGLITKYGGVASHMAIRCGEFGLPAAIGCGDVIFKRLQGARSVVLDCGRGLVHTVE